AWTANNGEALAFFNSARTLAVSLASLENQGPRISDERTRLDELKTALELDTQAKNNEIKALKETIANQDTTYANLYASYEEQGQSLTRPEKVVDALPAASASGNSSVRREKIPDPVLFSGEGGQKAFDEWLASMVIKFDIASDRFDRNRHKLAYLFGRTEGAAKQLLKPCFSSDASIALDNVESAYKILRQHFEDPDRIRTAEFEIKRLRQRNSPFSEYLSQFTRLAAELNWNDEAKLSLLREGISQELKQALLYCDVPDNYDGFVALCMKRDIA